MGLATHVDCHICAHDHQLGERHAWKAQPEVQTETVSLRHMSASRPSTCVLLLLVVGVDSSRCAVLPVPRHPGDRKGQLQWWLEGARTGTPSGLICAPDGKAGAGGGGKDSFTHVKCLRNSYTFQKRKVTILKKTCGLLVGVGRAAPYEL